MNIFKNFILQDVGGVIAEYSIVVTLILVFIIGAIALVGGDFVNNFSSYYQS